MLASLRPSLTLANQFWSGLLASDPGYLRLRSAVRATLSVAISAAILGTLLVWHDVPLLAPAIGIVLAMMAASLPREPAPRDRLITILLMAAAAGLSTIVAAFAALVPGLGEALLLLVLFGAVGLQSWGPRSIAIGLMAVVDVYLALFLHADPSHIGPALVAIPIALVVVLAVTFVIVPERPIPALRRIVRSVEIRVATLLHAIDHSTTDATPPTRLWLRRQFATLNETILSAEDQLAVIDTAAAVPMSTALMRLELALSTVSAAALAGSPITRKERARLRLAAMRLHAGRWSPMRQRGERLDTSLLIAVTDLEDAASILQDTTKSVAERLARGTSAPAKPAARPAFVWRAATRAAAAALLSMLGGYMISPDRWYWAVLTAYLVFLGARSRGEAVQKGLQRVGGTVAGLVMGVLVSFALTGHPYLEAGGLLICIFGLTYVFAVSQTLAIFCVTVMLGLIYSLAGADAEAILVLRLEETAIGAAAAILVGLYLLPRRTRDHVRETGTGLLGALADVVRLSARRLEGDLDAAPVSRMRQADRMLRDLRVSLRPLQARSTFVWWARPPAELPAIVACIFWVRVLAMSSETRIPEADLAPILARARDAAARLDLLANPGGSSGASAPKTPREPTEIGIAHVGQLSTALLQATLDNVEAVLDLMAERFDADGWTALVSRRPL